MNTNSGLGENESVQKLRYIYEKAIDEVVSEMFGEAEVKSVGNNELWRLNLSSVNIVKLIVAVQTKCQIPDIDIAGIIKNNALQTKKKFTDYLINADEAIEEIKN